MGSNCSGQLGINKPDVDSRSSPVLIDKLINCKIVQISCGAEHNLTVTKSGECYSWGLNSNGQCGIKGGMSTPYLYEPKLCNFDQYYTPKVKSVSAGGAHSCFVDSIGRLFMCGENDQGQLGIGSYLDEDTPYYVERIPEKVMSAVAGNKHTLVLTQKGSLYTMGANESG